MRATALLRPARLAAVPRLVSSLPLSAQRNMSTVSGLMQERPLLVSQLIDYAAKVHGGREIVSRTIEDASVIHRSSYAEVHRRSMRLAHALTKLGVQEGARVATVAWNGYRHMELYFAVSGMGAVLHTINPRMSPQQLIFVANHAQDEVVFVDLTFFAGISKLAPMMKALKHVVVLTDRKHMPVTDLKNVLCYEDLLDAAPEASFAWPDLAETAASSLCYTSGTTGDPKGVLFSHRSTVLHAWTLCAANSFALSLRDSCLPVVPMFHVNAWGLPYGACMAGCKLVLPGANLDGKSLVELMVVEKVTTAAGVPTIWQGLLAHMDATKTALPHFERTVIGGSACSPSMIEAFKEKGVHVHHAWGMTELSPTGVVNAERWDAEELGAEERAAYTAKQGREMFGIELACFDADGKECPRDGVTAGTLKCRGNWTVSGYFGSEKEVLDKDGWFDTGDLATITHDGYLQITDRAKDMIKSGGEWISSIDLENMALSLNPGIAQAAAIGVPHPKWDERPILCIVAKPDAKVTKEEVIASIAAKIPSWMVPEDVVFMDALPVGGTGKVVKAQLREQFKGHLTTAK